MQAIHLRGLTPIRPSLARCAVLPSAHSQLPLTDTTTHDTVHAVARIAYPLQLLGQCDIVRLNHWILLPSFGDLGGFYPVIPFLQPLLILFLFSHLDTALVTPLTPVYRYSSIHSGQLARQKATHRKRCTGVKRFATFHRRCPVLYGTRHGQTIYPHPR